MIIFLVSVRKIKNTSFAKDKENEEKQKFKTSREVMLKLENQIDCQQKLKLKKSLRDLELLGKLYIKYIKCKKSS